MKLNILIVLSSFLISLNSYAFKFSPMSTAIGIKENQNSTLFYLENDSDQPIAVTATLLKREMNVEGIETNSKVEGELTVYPSQLIIPPNEKRSVKVTWVGNQIPSMEQAYRLVAEQLPIELDKNKKQKASIKVLLRYVAALYVEAGNYDANISLKQTEVNDKFVSFLISNSGKKHQVLSNLSMKIDGKKNLNFTSEELKGMSGENILASTERIFRFPRVGKFKQVGTKDKVMINFEKD